MEEKVYSKKCPYCDKKITSLHKRQFEYNFNEHVKSCKKKQEKLEGVSPPMTEVKGIRNTDIL